MAASFEPHGSSIAASVASAHPTASQGLTGVLLVNTGTPDSPDPKAVGRYLRQFLSDKRVIDIHPWLRWLLVNVLIVPRRRVTSAQAYHAIWTHEGSPLLVESRGFEQALAQELDPSQYRVAIAMRYGNPSIADALEQLCAAHVTHLIIAPMFPQYASAATGSVVEELMRVLRNRWNIPALRVLAPFYDDADFIGAVVDRVRHMQQSFHPDHLLFSFHGLPERHIRKSQCACCDVQQQDPPPTRACSPYCYRGQCVATARLVAAQLGLRDTDYTVAFQSRLGRTPWIKPYTDHILPKLARDGRKRLAVVCPSFVADCLETREEVGIRTAQAWRALGGEALQLVPCVNAHPLWVHSMARMIQGTN